jgi:hypothetical protein
MVVASPVWAASLLFLDGPWYDGLWFAVSYSCIVAVGDHIYFKCYGGTEADYPFPPDQKANFHSEWRER